MKILVTGGDGMLGRAVVSRLATDHQLVGVDLPDGDLVVAGDVRDIIRRVEPEWIIHCAAWTDVDGAESNRDAAMAANAGATGNLVEVCRAGGLGLTYISTDYVFDGRGEHGGYDESDRRDPVNHYGLTKARGEELVEGLPGDWQILRTSWLFGDGRVNFPKTIRRLLDERETLQVVEDQRGCPTYADDLAGILGFLVSSRRRGIFHGTNAGACSWHELAREVAVRRGADPERVVPCPSSAWPTQATRPACSVLRSSRLERAGCPDRAGWPDAVGRYLELLDSGRALHP